MTMTLQSLAQRNFLAMGHPYPGRAIVIGRDLTGKYLVQIYWVMGRSKDSRNRVLRREAGKVYTEAFDPSKVKDPELLIYNAMMESPDVFSGENQFYVVSNGRQTDDSLVCMTQELLPLCMALECWTYEPDSCTTSRIAGACTVHADWTYKVELCTLRKSAWSDDCDRVAHSWTNLKPGFGFCISTYLCDGDPPPPFVGEPQLMPIVGDIKQVAQDYWAMLNRENKVALAVKFIPLSPEGQTQVVILNKLQKE